MTASRLRYCHGSRLLTCMEHLVWRHVLCEFPDALELSSNILCSGPIFWTTAPCEKSTHSSLNVRLRGGVWPRQLIGLQIRTGHPRECISTLLESGGLLTHKMHLFQSFAVFTGASQTQKIKVPQRLDQQVFLLSHLCHCLLHSC